jgi:hypothetical protein
MSFLDKSTLTYPATNTFPGRRWLDTRNPVSGANGDYKMFQISDIWINNANDTAWILVDRTATAGTWIQMASTGTGILHVTGNSGGAVSADGANNINLLGSGTVNVAGNAGTNTLTITATGSTPTQFDEDSGSAIPSANILRIVGTAGIVTSGATNVVTITTAGTVPTTFTEDAGAAQPSGNNLNILGGTGISTSGAGSTVTINAKATVPLLFTEQSGSATPAANNLNIIGSGGITTSGAGIHCYDHSWSDDSYHVY